jgi:hypothetical protein
VNSNVNYAFGVMRVSVDMLIVTNVLIPWEMLIGETSGDREDVGGEG